MMWDLPDRMQIKTNLNFFLVFSILFNWQNCSVVQSSSQTRGIRHTDGETHLRLAQVVFRHGDRTPFGTYPLDPYRDLKYWPDGFAQLTKKGKMMHYDLGRYFRWRYSGFLSKSYSRNEVHARSSDADRTIMSVQANLAGLFPPRYDDNTSMWNPLIKWQPIPFRTISTEVDKLIRFGAECPRYNQLFAQLHSSPPVRDLNKENKELYEYLTKHTGQDVIDYKGVADLYDTLFIEQLYDLQLPEWTQSVYPSKMEHLAIIEFKFATYTDEMKKLLGGPLLTDLIRHMDMKINPPKTQPKNFYSAKLQMYSGHDTTVAALLAVLGIYDERHIPPYASTVFLELHENVKTKARSGSTEDKDYFIRVFYRNETSSQPMEFEIPGCISNDTKLPQERVCTYDKFKSTLRHLTVNDWEKECGMDFTPIPSDDLGFYNRLSLATGGKDLNVIYDALGRFYDAYISPFLEYLIDYFALHYLKETKYEYEQFIIASLVKYLFS